jgi:RNA polymerase sigma factor (sigma-70 family)
MAAVAGLIPRKVFVHSPKGGFQATRYFKPDESLHQYFKEVNAIPLLTQEEETKLANKYRKKKDQAAGAQLVRSNLRLVAKIAYTYSRSKIPLADLIQQGNLGLMAAIKKFDPKKARLSTYATQWIKAYINRYVKDRFENIKAEEEIPEQEGAKQLVSHVIDPEKAYAIKEQQNRINSAVNKLNSNEQYIIKNRLLSDDPRSIEEVGSEIGLSKQKAFNLEKQALVKLKQFLIVKSMKAWRLL